MILIADSGSTKTDWCVVLNGTVIKRLGTKGINPFFQSEEEIQQKLTASLLPQLPEGKFNAVYFYGAGCTPEKAPVLRRAIADSLPVIGNIKANSDMLAAAHGLCGQKAAIACLNGPRDEVEAQRLKYQERRDALCDGLEGLGWERPNAHGSMFVWAKLPGGRTDSMAFCEELMEKAGVVVTPGASFGPSGEGHVRMALVQDEEVIREALQSIKESGILNL